MRHHVNVMLEGGAEFILDAVRCSVEMFNGAQEGLPRGMAMVVGWNRLVKVQKSFRIE